MKENEKKETPKKRSKTQLRNKKKNETVTKPEYQYQIIV